MKRNHAFKKKKESEHSGHASIKLIVLDAGPSGDDQRFLEVRGRAVHELDPPLGCVVVGVSGRVVQLVQKRL